MAIHLHLAACIFLFWNPNPAPAVQANSFTVHFVRFTPAAIFSDGADATTFTARITGPVKKVFILPDRIAPGVYEPAKLLVDGKKTTEVELFDNGTHGDRLAGDGIYTRSNIRANDGSTAFLGTTMRILDTNGATHKVYTSEYGGGVPPVLYLVARKHQVAVKNVDANWRTSKRVANLRTSTIFKLTDSTATTSDPDINAVRAAYLSRFPDAQDFIVVYLTQPCMIGYYYFTHYRNEVKGLGLNIFETPGSSKLRGVLLLHNTPGAFLHEVMHDWGVFLANPEFAGNLPHWGAVNIPGLLWGLDFVPVGGGKYKVTLRYGSGVYGQKVVKYPPMELYMMGALPAEQVPAVTVLEGIDPGSYNEGDLMTPTGVKTVSMAAIIAQNGARQPSVTASQKSFQVAAVLITPNVFASDAEMAVFTLFQKNIGLKKSTADWNFGRSFYAATGGRAKMIAKLPKPKAAGAPVRPTGSYAPGRIVICPACAQPSATGRIHRHN